MSGRQEALRRQYEERVGGGGGASAPTPRGFDGNGRPLPRVRPRNRFWRWFWLIFLLTLLGERFEQDGKVTAVGRVLGTEALHQGGVSANARPSDGSIPEVDAAAITAYLTPSEAEMDQLYSYVANAPFVAENLQYRDRMKDLPFIFVATNDIVNAAASRRPMVKDGEKGIAFYTVFYGGAARYARLVGLAAALQDAGHKGMLKKFVAAMPPSFCVRCGTEACVKFIAENGLVEALADGKIRQRAMSYSSGTIAYVIAHECGHHALGHLLGFSEKQNLEIVRNQEREADSFASSVISASPFGEYMFAGTLFWSYALAKQTDGDSDSGRSHPLWKERFENLVRANAEKAAAMGIVLGK